MIKALAALQDANISRALAAPAQRWLFGDEMGCGKTRQALLTAKAIAAPRMLVVCPAMARETWRAQVAKWLPERLDDVAIIDMSPDRASQSNKRKDSWAAELEKPIRVISPGLLNVEREKGFIKDGATIITDEHHMYVTPDSQQSMAMRAILERHEGAHLALTATPIPNRLQGLWNQLDLIWPGRFGAAYRKMGKPAVPWVFLQRYLNREWIDGASRWVWGSAREDRLPELRGRLSHMMSRITRKEIAHLLPTCQVRPMPTTEVKGMAIWRPWVDEVALDASHIIVLFHRRKSVHQAAALLERAFKGWTIINTCGEDPPAQRAVKIEQARTAARSMLVTTMHAVKESIDLSWAERILLAELYWRPATLTQVIGRFGRPGGVPSILDVLCQPGTVYERMASAVSDKLMDSAAAVSAGQAETALSAALTPPSMNELMQLATSVVLDDDVFGDLDETEW